MKKILTLILASLLAVSVLAGCGSSTPAPQTTAAGGDKETAAESVEPTTPDTAGNKDADIRQDEGDDTVDVQLAGMTRRAPKGEYFGDLIVMACQSGVTSWDPTTRGGGYSVGVNVFERLGQADKQGKLYLTMLKSIEKKSDLDYECELWDFITDTAGNNITANDVKWSIQTYVDAGNLGAVAKLDNIEVTGDYTFIWHNKEPFGPGEYVKQISNPPIYSQKAYESDPDHMANNPVGTGPYKVKDFMEGSFGLFEVNEDYWFNKIDDEAWLAENDYVSNYQNFKEIRCDVISDASARAIALENGSVDGCSSMNYADVSMYAGNPDISVVDVPVDPPVAFYFNLSDQSVCKDVNLRKAICYAIDNAAIAEGIDAPAFQVYGIQPRMIDAPKDWLTGREYYDFNQDKAKELLAQSSYAGEPIKVYYTDGDMRAQVWVLVQAELAQIGINLDLHMIEMSAMGTVQYDWGAWDIRGDTFGGGSYVANTTRRWWSGEVMNQLNGLNVCGVEDKELDALYETMLADSSEANIDAWDQYFTYDNCIGYAICGFNNQTACSSKWIPAVSGNQNQFCPGAFSPAE